MRPPRVAIIFVLTFLSTSVLGLAAVPRKIVVRNSAEFQEALRNVPEGGVIELAAGIYVAPAKGFSITKPKGFTVRPAPRAAVFLDGQGQRVILRIKNNAKGKPVVFQRITFRNGASKTEGDSGAVTMNAAVARFEQCNFLDNSATGKTTGGGAVGMTAASTATFLGSNFRNNSSGNRGGAVSVINSSFTFRDGEFTDNRTNLGPKLTTIGGGIYALNSTVLVSGSRFLRNEAAWVGGAIEAFGTWTAPLTTPRSLVTVVRSTFKDNRAIPSPCCGQPPVTAGGAIHVEDQTTLRVFGSHFIDNAADHGGALDSYRAAIEVTGSIFLGNRTPLVAGKLGVGGAIAIASNDSAMDGADNRPPGRLSVTDSLLQGGVIPPATPANTGGCVAVDGDWSRIYGSTGVAPSGTLEENRSPVVLRRVAFVDCNVAQSAAGGGLGGGVTAGMANLTLDNSLLMDSDARGAGGGGGGVALQRESTAVISATTFSHNSAERSGGALFLGGSTVQVTGCRFLRNEVRPSFPQLVSESRGAAIFAIPQLGQIGKRDVGGLVTGSVFSENVGIPLWDVETGTGAPCNLMRYDNNQFYEQTFGDRIYANTVNAKTGVNTAFLDSLNVFQPGCPALDKGNGNVRLFSVPAVGALLASPPSLGTGAPAAGQSFLAYAWSGIAAVLDGQGVSTKTGLAPVFAVGAHTLLVNGNPVATVQLAPAPAVP
jgi:hypothetical protein